MTFLCLAAGCGSDAVASFTLKDLERWNAFELVFAEYNSVRARATFYDFGPPGDFTQTAVFVKGTAGITTYVEFSFEEKYTVEGRNVYVENADGTYGITAFFDDGLFEEYYLPLITKWIAYTPTNGEKVISSSIDGDIRKLVTHARASAMEDFDGLGIPDGTVESNYEMDAISGLLLRAIDYLIPDDGNRRLLSETEIQYGNDDAFTPPRYVTLCKDMTRTRTVHYIRSQGKRDEKTFSFTIPKKAALYPATMEALELYEDKEFTVPFAEVTNDFPDEMTLYMRNG
jgi:hypothetical protein